MTALPSAIAWTDASVTEGGFKTAQTDLRSYLNGLLGADGVAATARAALAVPPIASPVLTGELVVAQANSASLHVYSDTASEGVIETHNTSTPATKYRTNINKYGGEVRVGSATGISVVDDVNGYCVGINHTTPNASGRLSVIETNAKPVAKFAGTQQGVVMEATNESFSALVANLLCHRTANSAYTFLSASSDSNGTPDLEFNLRGDGTAFADGSFTGSGADYQEYFHSTDRAALKVGECVVLDGDQVRLATQNDTPDAVIGVVRPKEDNKNSAVVGNAAWNHWSEKYLTDDYGRYLQEEYRLWEWEETIAPVMQPRQRHKQVLRTVTREAPVVESGRAVLKLTTTTVSEGEYTEHPLFDAQGRPVFAERAVYGPDGAPLMTEQVVMDEQGKAVLIDGVPAVRRQAVMQRTQAVHREPVMETVMVEVEAARTVRHSVAEGKIPAGVSVPANAAVTVLKRRKLNPDFREAGDYTPRHERPEWNLIGLLGQVQIRDGAPVNPRWVRMKPLANGVSLWFIR